MCWGAGILLSSGVVRAVAGIDGDLGWRLPFALQFVWPLPLFIGAYLAPESPWNAVRRGKFDVARASLMRLRRETSDKEREVDSTLAYIKYTTELERAETEHASFWECFKGTNLRRTEIVSRARRSSSARDFLTNYLYRTVSYGQRKSFAAMPSSGIPWCSSRPPAFRNSRRSTSIFLFRHAISSAALSAGFCSLTWAERPFTWEA